MIKRELCPCCKAIVHDKEYDIPQVTVIDEFGRTPRDIHLTANISRSADSDMYEVPKVWLSAFDNDRESSKDDVQQYAFEFEIRFCPYCGRDLIDLIDATENRGGEE